MTDIVMVAIFVAFFALSVAFVTACERIVGPDVESQRPENDDERLAA